MEKKLHSLKRTFSVLLALVILVCFTGCMRYSLKAKVDRDGTVDVVFVYAIMEDYAEGIMESREDLEEVLGDSDYEFRIEDYDEDGFVGFTIMIDDVDINELDDVMVYELGIDSFSLREKDGVYTIKWDTSAETSEASSSGIDASTLSDYDGYMKFSIELPGKAFEDNAQIVSGNTYEWNLMDMDEPIFISFALRGAFPFPYSTKVTINKDKTADLEVLIAAVEEEDDALEDRISIFEDNDWEITEEDGKKVTGIFGEKDGLEIEEIGEELEALGIGYDGFTVDFDEDEGLYSIDWDATLTAQNADTSEISAFAKKDFGKYMTFVLELPNSAEDENATEADGKILTWELLAMDEEVHAEFKIKKSGIAPWLIGVIIGGVIILAGIIVMIIILSKRKKSPKDPAPVAAPVVPTPVSPAPAPSYIPTPSSSATPIGTPTQPISPFAAPSQPASPFAAPAQPSPVVPQAPSQSMLPQFGQPNGFQQTNGLPQVNFRQTMGLPVVGMPSSNESTQPNNDNQLPPTEDQG